MDNGSATVVWQNPSHHPSHVFDLLRELAIALVGLGNANYRYGVDVTDFTKT